MPAQLRAHRILHTAVDATPCRALPPCPPGSCCCREPGKEYPPFTAYWKPAITNCVGPACGLHALKYISYPAQARRGRAEAGAGAVRSKGRGRAPTWLARRARAGSQIGAHATAGQARQCSVTQHRVQHWRGGCSSGSDSSTESGAGQHAPARTQAHPLPAL